MFNWNHHLVRWLPVPAAMAVLLMSGVVHGLWTDRWIRFEESCPFDEARVAEGIATIGDWKSDPLSLDPSQIAPAGISRYVARRYSRGSRGDELSVLLVWGRPGPLAAHTPVTCFQGAGSEMVGEPIRYVVNSGSSCGSAEFWMARFRHTGSPVPECLLVLWSWNANGAWQVVEDPRFSFAHCRALYKLYVVRRVPKSDVALDEGPGVEFLRALLPQLENSLFPRS
jgi:hypothetical protein